MTELEHVKFDLFDFQQEEVERLYKLKSRLLAWEMGTGKTYGGIAFDIENRGYSIEQSLKQNGNEGAPRKTLVVCPKSVLDVWDQHTMELTDLDVTVIDTKNRDEFIKEVKDPRRGGYFILHWEALRLIPELREITFFHIIADECHRAKNRKAQQTIALKKIKTLYKTALSGTPADNKPLDFWSILNWLWPKVYKSYWAFYKAYIVDEMSWEGYRKIIGVQNVDHLLKMISPWYSRKLKEDVLKDLPEKYRSTLWVDLHPKQRTAYNSMVKSMVAWVDQHSDEIERQDPIIAQAVISQLVRLQQFAVGYVIPEMDDNGQQKYKWKWPKGTPKEDKLRFASSPEDGGAKKQLQFLMTDPSSKLDALMDIIEDNEGESLVVFTQFKSVIKLLGERLDKKGITHGLYTGDTSQQERKEIIDGFQAGEIQIFAGTIAAGGVGITLTKASTVVFLDKAWSPSWNQQAEDRLHRIGQKNAVHVIEMMAKDTVDIGRKEMIDQKADWLRQILGDKVARLNFKRVA